MPLRPPYLKLFTNPIQFFEILSAAEGTVAQWKLGRQTYFLINDPAIIQDVLVTRGSIFQKFPRVKRANSLFGDGLLTSEEPLHRQQRRLIQPLFHQQALARYAQVMLDATVSAASTWTDGEVINTSHEMSRLTLNIITRTVFAMDDEQAESIASEMDFLLRMLNHLVMPWGDVLMRLPLPLSRRYRRTLRNIDQVIDGVIREGVRTENDMVSMLLESEDPETGRRLNHLQIRDELITMFVAGHDTTANALIWSLYLLARHPELQDELAESLPPQITLDTLPQLEKVRCAFAESLRLYPPVWILGRQPQEDYSFADFTAKKNSILLICPAVLHRCNEYFNDSDLYKPERMQHPDWPKYAFIPFGGGTRLCVGERFAWMEGVLCLAILLRSWRFETVTPADAIRLGQLTLRPKHPIELKVRARSSLR